MRLFVAIDLDDAARDLAAAAVAALETAGLNARFEPREKLHATVAFLGSVTPERYGEIAGALGEAAARSAPFAVTLDAVGAFPNERRPRVVWLGARRASPGYAACADAVREAYAKLGWTFQEEPVPHVTLCRLKQGSHPLPHVVLPRTTTVHVDALTLYESVPEGRRTCYLVRKQVRLGSAPQARS